jgi:hypothetical protein
VRSHPQKLKCGEKSVARCAQIEFSTKCRRDCSEEQRKIEEGKLRRESDINIQGKESLNFTVKASGKDSSSEGGERSQTIRSGEVARRRTVKYFGTSEVRQVENLTKAELRSPKSRFNLDH